MASEEIKVQYERTEEIARNIQAIADQFPENRNSQTLVSGCSGATQNGLFGVMSGLDDYGTMARHLMTVTAGFLDMAAKAFRDGDDTAAGAM